MLKLILIILLGESILLSADSEIFISATVASHAKLQHKRVSFNNENIEASLYLQSNTDDLNINLTESKNRIFISYALLNGHYITSTPMNLTSKECPTLTKIGNLIISRDEGIHSLSLTISVK